MIKQYHRKPSIPNRYIFLGIMMSISGLFLINISSYSTGILQLAVGLSILGYGLLLRKPYIELRQGFLHINKGYLRKEIILKDITTFTKSDYHLAISYSQGSSNRTYQIALYILKDADKEKFVKELKPMLTRVKSR